MLAQLSALSVNLRAFAHDLSRGEPVAWFTCGVVALFSVYSAYRRFGTY